MLGTLAPSQPCLTWWCTALAPHPTSLQSDGDTSQQLQVVRMPPQVMVMVMANEQDEEVMVMMVVVVMVMVMERREMMMVVNDGEMVEVMVEMMMDPPSWGL